MFDAIVRCILLIHENRIIQAKIFVSSYNSLNEIIINNLVCMNYGFLRSGSKSLLKFDRRKLFFAEFYGTT